MHRKEEGLPKSQSIAGALAFSCWFVAVLGFPSVAVPAAEDTTAQAVERSPTFDAQPPPAATDGGTKGADGDEKEEEDQSETDNDEESDQEDAACKRLNHLLPGEKLSQRTGITTEGWLDQGFTWNPAGPTDRFNGPLSHNDRANEYQLNQLYVICQRPADKKAECVSWGFHGDLIYGTDAFLFQSLGLDDNTVSDRDSRFYKLAFPQLYLEMFLPIGPGITAQAGKWFTLVSYERGLATEDFFYSHPLGYNGVAYSATGLLLSSDLTERISTSHGIHRGSDCWEDNNDDLGYTGIVTWTGEDKKTVAYTAVQVGPEQDERADWQDLDGLPGPDFPGHHLNRVNASATLEQQLTEKLQYVFNYDYFYQDGVPNSVFPGAEAHAFTQYLYYEFNETFKGGLRIEIFRDSQGFLGSGFRSNNAAAPATYTDLTLGLHIRQGKCITWRPEIRWDWQNRDNPDDTPAFNAGRSSRQFLAAVDMVVRF
jgi:hypothetical protein